MTDVFSFLFVKGSEGEFEMQLGLRGFTLDAGLDESVRYKRGFHGHVYGDLTRGCGGLGGHFNPAGMDHGAPGHHHRSGTVVVIFAAVVGVGGRCANHDTTRPTFLGPRRDLVLSS